MKEKVKMQMIVPELILAMLLAGCGDSGVAQEATNSQPTQTYESASAETREVQEPKEEISNESEPADEAPEPETTEALSKENFAVNDPIIIGEDELEEMEAEEAEETEEKVEVEQVKADKEEAESQPAYEFGSLDGSLDAVLEACSTSALCETDKEASVIRTSVNPYDVVYDYGEVYDAYADACDWSLVFDIDYYMTEFPMLALQYHYDEELLFEHFRTVGVHEGRQGSKDFNVYAYAINADKSVNDAFKGEYAAYYIYYMMNYDKESSVDAITPHNGKDTHTQYKVVYTWYQKAELAKVNKYREAEGVKKVMCDPELSAFANYRAYLNAHDGYIAHDWAEENISSGSGIGNDYIRIMSGGKGKNYAENTFTNYMTTRSGASTIGAVKYNSSKPHHDAMVNSLYGYIGISNILWDDANGRGNAHSQFDVYLDDMGE